MPHTGLDRSEALDLLTEVFPTALEEPAGLYQDLDIKGFHSDHVAVVQPDSQGEQRGLLTSTLPLRVEEQNGTKRPVDLELEHEAGQIQPTNPLVEVDIPPMLTEGIGLPQSDIDIELEGAPSARSASTVDGTAAFYPNVATDSDLTVIPTPTGVETLTLLRSPEAPTDQTFRLNLPEGTQLEGTADGGAEAKREGKTILVVRPPTAIDAAGEPVPVSMEVSGNSLTLHASPQPESVYPILVDPIYHAYYWMAWGGPAGMYTDWLPYSTNEKYFKPSWYGILGQSQYAGLDFRSYPGPVVPGERAAWNFYVPRYFSDLEDPAVAVAPTSYIRAMSLSYVYFHNEEAAPGFNHPYILAGLWDEYAQKWVSAVSHTTWEGNLNAATIELSNPPEVTNVKFGGLMLATSETTSRPRHAFVGQAAVEVSDKDLPSFGFTPSPTKWMDSSAVEPVDFMLSDAGLGAFSITAKMPSARGGSSVTNQTAGCAGAASSPCPRSWSSHVNFNPSQVAQGENIMEVTGKDPIGYSTAAPKLVKVKVDHTSPLVALSGSLTEQATVGTQQLEYRLDYQIKDGDEAAPEALSPIGQAGTAAGQLERPLGIAVAPKDYIWVTDRINRRIIQYDKKGTFIRQFGTPGTAAGQINEPRGVAIAANGNLWVAEAGNKRIQQFTTTGTYVRAITSSKFQEPWDVAAGPDGTIWVADTGAKKIFQFKESGEFIGEYAVTGAPVGIGVDRYNNAWIAVQSTNRILSLVSGAQEKAAGSQLILNFAFGSSGSQNGQLNTPVDVAVAPSGNLLVSDGLNSRVQVFKPDGTYLRQLGSVGSATSQFNEPRALAMGEGNDLFVVDSGNRRIARWSHADKDPQSGAAQVQVKVDGVTAKTDAPGCATKNCSITGSWLLEVDDYSAGPHQVELIATDAVGRSTSRILSIETHGDQASPDVALSGPMTEQGTLGVTRPAYKLKVSATDPASAEERSSGVAGTTVEVDGAIVDATWPGCPTEGCSITREWTLDSTDYSVGSHSVKVTATDAAGHITTKSLTIDIAPDTTAPELEASSAFFAAPDGWLEQKSYLYTATATDVSGYGVTSMVLKIDGEPVESFTQSCPAGACGGGIIDASIDMADYDGGSHPAELIATDGAGNSRKRSWTINVDPMGEITDGEATDTLEAVERTAPEATEYTPVSGLVSTFQDEEPAAMTPELTYEEGQIVSDSQAPSTISTDPAVGFSLDTTSVSDVGTEHNAEIAVTPLHVGANASGPTITNDAAAVIANTENHVDMVLRPIYDGLMSFKAIRDRTGSESYEWEVQLDVGEELRLINSKHAGIFWDDGTQALLISAQAAHAADGTEVPTSLAVSGNIITQTVHHGSGSYVYPVVAGVGWQGGFVEYAGQITEPYASSNEPDFVYSHMTEQLVTAPPEVYPAESSDPEGASASSSPYKYLKKFGARQCENMPAPVYGCGIWEQKLKGFFWFNYKKVWQTREPACPQVYASPFVTVNDPWRCAWAGPSWQIYGGGHHITAQVLYSVTWAKIATTTEKHLSVYAYGSGYWNDHDTDCVCNPLPVH